MRNAIEVLDDLERAAKELDGFSDEENRLLDLIIELQERQDILEEKLPALHALKTKLDQLYILMRHIAVCDGYLVKQGDAYSLTRPKPRSK